MKRCNYCGSLMRDHDVSAFLEKVMLLIEQDNLNIPSRAQNKTHKRYFLYKKMRDFTDLTFEEIGEYFGRDHATVMHGIKKHDLYTDIKDSKYLKDTDKYDNLLQDYQRHINAISC